MIVYIFPNKWQPTLNKLNQHFAIEATYLLNKPMAALLKNIRKQSI